MTYELFIQLREWSRQDDSFSIRDFAKSVGMTYKAIYDLPKENEDWEHEFNVVRSRLAYNNAEKALHSRKIKAWSQYIYENDCFLKEHFFEESGLSVPEVAENHEAFDKWHKERYKIERIKYRY